MRDLIAERRAFEAERHAAWEAHWAKFGPETLETVRTVAAREDAERTRKYCQERTIKLKGDIIITDPCYILRDDGAQLTRNDWQTCDMGANMEALGIQNYLVRDTVYGDWSCTTYRTDTKEPLGHFCADTGLVAVFLLSEVLAYNPKFDYHLARPHTCTLIRDFDGEVTIKVAQFTFPETDEDGKETGETCLDEEVRVLGQGNVNFFTTQTGI